jgi:predicted nucleic-acid-binding protein
MTFVDTNYFLRFLLADNLAQHQKAKKLFLLAAEGKEKLFTSLVVFFEIYWVLTSFYEKNKSEVAQILNNVLKIEFLGIESKEILKEALNIYKKTSLDLEDAYNIVYAKSKKASEFKTFDTKLNKVFKEKSW